MTKFNDAGIVVDPKDHDEKNSIYHDLYHRKATRDEWEVKRSAAKRLPINLLYFFLGIILPIAGSILWVVFKDDRPKDAVYPGVGSLIGWVLLILFNVVRMLMGMSIY